MTDKLKDNITRPSIWMRLISMIILAIAFNIAEIVIFAVVVFQFLISLFTQEPNGQLVRFGNNLAVYLRQIVAFLTFATEEKPFPFSSWPDEEPEQPAAKVIEAEADDAPSKRRSSQSGSKAGSQEKACAAEDFCSTQTRTSQKGFVKEFYRVGIGSPA